MNYLAAIEAMDAEIERLLGSLLAAERESTLIICIGDNGRPQAVVDTFAYYATHVKNTLYECGVYVSTVVVRAGVERIDERESALAE